MKNGARGGEAKLPIMGPRGKTLTLNPSQASQAFKYAPITSRRMTQPFMLVHFTHLSKHFAPFCGQTKSSLLDLNLSAFAPSRLCFNQAKPCAVVQECKNSITHYICAHSVYFAKHRPIPQSRLIKANQGNFAYCH
jgi:hypothetical protein